MSPSILSIIEDRPIALGDNTGCYTCDAPGCECYSEACDCDNSPPCDADTY